LLAKLGEKMANPMTTTLLPFGPYPFPIPAHNFFWVPCVVDPVSMKFQPLFSYSEFVERPPAIRRPQEAEPSIFSFRKDEWTQDEDLALFRHVVLKGPRSWSRVSRDLNDQFHGSRNVRIGKHCRGRWLNHLDPSIKSNPYSEEGWSEAEDKQLLQLHKTIGNRWSSISKEMAGRNENSVKNRWNSLMRQAMPESEGPTS
jgi:hypothetical protein